MPVERDVPRRYAADVRVRFDEAGPDGALRASGVMRYVQDTAWQHSERAGFDRAWYLERGLTWLVRAFDLALVAPALYGDILRVSTEVVGWRRFWARRRSEVRRFGDERVVHARAEVDWVLVGASGRLTRVPREIEAFAEPGATFSPTHVSVPRTPASAMLSRSRVQARDLDPMGHANHATFLDYLDEALAPVAPPAVRAVPRRVRMEYVRQALPDTELVSACWAEGTGWAWRLTDAADAEICRAWAWAGLPEG